MTEWLTGIDIGQSPFTLLIRSKDDPDRLSRKKSQELFGESASTRWQRIRKETPTQWLPRILAHLEEHGAMTFNALMLGLTGRTVTADVAFEAPPHAAVAHGIQTRQLQITAEAPCLLAPTPEDSTP